MERPKHVLILTSEFGTRVSGGLGTYMDQLCRCLKANDWQVSIGLILPGYVSLIDTSAGERTLFAEHLAGSAQDEFDQWSAANAALVEGVEQVHPTAPFTLVASHDWITFPAGQTLATRLGVPHVLTIQWLQSLNKSRYGLPLDRRYREIEHQMCTQPDYVITDSDFMRDYLCAIAPAAREKIERIYNAVDPVDYLSDAESAVQALRRRLAPEGEQLVLFIGRLTEQKGLEYLAASATEVRRTLPNTRWVVVGDGATPAITDWYRTSLVAQHILFVGQQPRHALGCFYRAADCLVMPSIFEPFGYVAAEAMAVGTPVIVSDVDGLREVVEHGVSGWRVPMVRSADGRLGPDVQELARAQVAVLSDPTLHARLAANGRRRIAESFLFERIAPQIAAAYARAGSRSAVRAAGGRA